MAICERCQFDNPPERDFCAECGYYVRWMPTGPVDLVQDDPPAAAPSSTHRQQPIRISDVRRAVERVPVARGRAAPVVESAPAGVVLFVPGHDAGAAETVTVAVAAGGQAVLRATIRNNSQIVEGFKVRLSGLPEGWWTTTPAIVRLVPRGTAGPSEDEVEIRLHPPRSPEAEARAWNFQVVAEATVRAAESSARSAPAELLIEPFTEHVTAVRPERVAGRRRGRFAVTVSNRGNAPATIALSAADPEERCAFAADPAELRIAPGQTATARMTARPKRQIWIGSGHDHAVKVAVAAGAGDPATQPVVYRQRPWLPRWAIPAAGMVAAAAAAGWMWLPRYTVPELESARSGFAA
jgi:hypothetical protein